MDNANKGNSCCDTDDCCTSTRKNVRACPCPKKTCPNNGICCACIAKHKDTDSLPFCLFSDNDGDKSLKNFYNKLKERFEI
jgi:hypothetical protein